MTDQGQGEVFATPVDGTGFSIAGRRAPLVFSGHVPNHTTVVEGGGGSPAEPKRFIKDDQGIWQPL